MDKTVSLLRREGGVRTPMRSRTPNSFQLWYAALVTLLGIILLFCSFYAPPQGEISPTVMVAFGEICTFSGALMGLDYKWRNRENSK